MIGEFTFERYGALLDAGLEAGYAFLTLREYLSTDRESLPERFIVLRHDVDRKPENAASMARIEADRDVPSTYYFRTIEKTFQPELIQGIEALGHEIGYHYEDMDRADGDIERAHESFATHLGRLRDVATVDTVCMHGNPLTPHDNRDMWDDGESEGYERYGLLGEAYLSMDFTDVTYFSDTGRTWLDGALKIKDYTVGEASKDVQVDTTTELIDLLEMGRLPRLCLLAHPNRWAGTRPELGAEYSKDVATNLAKRGLNAIDQARRVASQSPPLEALPSILASNARHYAALQRSTDISLSDPAVLDGALAEQSEYDTVFVHAGLSDIKRAFGGDPYELLVEQLTDHFETVLAPAFTPSFRETGLYHKQYSTPEFGAFSRLFHEDSDYRTDDAIHSISVKGEYRFDGCDHHDTFAEEGCWGQLDRDNVLFMNIGTDWLVSTQIHYIEERANVPYVSRTASDGVVYYDDETHERITQYNSDKIDWLYFWNRSKIRERLRADGALDRYTIGGLDVLFFPANDMRRLLESELAADPYYLVK
jgi:aminoglycoside N3'-acetyltransferase